MAARKTAYAANQHSISIIGSDIGTAHIPGNFKRPEENTVGSPVHSQLAQPVINGNEKLPRTPPQQPQQLQATHEENLQGLLMNPQNENAVVHNEPRSPVNFDRAENSPSHHGSPVK